ncbi:MAG: hypothetical protein K0B16_07030 [Burkholderiaceae bacterium]|nr:hypothetical protein [Burkholderiaceae bacterium]
MNMQRTCCGAALVLASVLAGGCAAPAATDSMTVFPAIATVQSVPQALRANVAIRDVTGGSETNPAWVSKVGSGEFRDALEGSLRSAGMLAPNAQSGRFLLTAHLEKLDQPYFGFDMTVTATVAYNLSERATGKDVFKKSLATPFTAKVSDAIYAPTRLKLANEGAIRTNIQRLLDELARLSL